MKITATFTGTNGSLGYVTGRHYDLYVSQGHGKEISIHRLADGSGACVYSSIISFFENWNKIQVIKTNP